MKGSLHLLDLGNTPIFTFEELAYRLIPHFKLEYENLEFFERIFSAGTKSSLENVQLAIQSKSNMKNKNLEQILDLIFTCKMLEDSFSYSDEYYKLTLSTVNFIRGIRNIDAEFLADELIVKQLDLFEVFKDNLDELINGYKFLKNISMLLNQVVDMKEDLISLKSSITALLFKKIENSNVFEIPKENEARNVVEALHGENERKLKEIINDVVNCQKLMIELDDFKDILKFIIDECKNMNCISKEFEYQELDQVNIFVPINDQDNDILDIIAPADEEEIFKRIQRLDTVYLRRDHHEIRVFKCIDEITNQLYAIKEVIAVKEDELESYRQEANLLKRLSVVGKNFLKFYGTKLEIIKIGNQNKFKFQILMEYVERDLKVFKTQRNQFNMPLNEDEIRSIYEQLITSFNILRSMNILHRDIKPTNVLITDDFVLKIIDFNIARLTINEVTHLTGAIGTLDFSAPEIRESFQKKVNIRSDKADVYSLGLTILFLVIDDYKNYFNQEHGKIELKKALNSIPYPWLKINLEKMLEFDYHRRIDFKELVNSLPSLTEMTESS